MMKSLGKLEALAQDGPRVSNAHLLAFAYLANSLASPYKALRPKNGPGQWTSYVIFVTAAFVFL